jgi:hypothetical protein
MKPEIHAMKRLHTRAILTMTALCFLGAGCREPAPGPAPQDFLNESQDAFDARMQWWRDARFGMFIHWGAYAVPAGVYEGEQIQGIGEWIMNTSSGNSIRFSSMPKHGCTSPKMPG